MNADEKKSWEAVRACLPVDGLKALKAALAENDPALLQGATTSPPMLMCVMNWPCKGGCAVAYAVWKDGLHTVAEVEKAFASVCYEADVKLDEPAGCRHFLNWFDSLPRDEMRREMLELLADV